MIRNTKINPIPTQLFSQTQTIHYRNAVFQGEYNKQREQKLGKGIIYVSNTHHFIACSEFQQNLLSGSCFFFHQHCKYSYGRWRENKPHGFAVFRMYQILVITEYKHGQLTKGTTILIIFEKYNTALVLKVVDDENWQMMQKHEVDSPQQLQDLIMQCKFHQNQQICHSLMKFVNSQMVSQSKCVLKLRLISNKYYRYGFDKGLAIIFDDQFKILSTGIHNRAMLCDVGIKYNHNQTDSMIQQGIFDGRNTFVFNQQNKPQQKIERTYNKYHLSAINFRNQFFVDPSESYFKYLQRLLQSSFIKEIFANAVNKSNEYDSYEKMMFQEKEQFSQQYQKWKQTPGFKKKDNDITHLIKPKDKQIGMEIIKMNMNKNMEALLKDSRQFSKLSQKNRLEILRQELYQNLNQKKFPAKATKQRTKIEADQIPRQRSKIINMEPVNVRNVEKSRNKQNMFVRQQMEKSGEQIIPQIAKFNHNLEIMKNIVYKQESNNNLQGMKNVVYKQESVFNKSKSKSRLKIFEFDKSIKREYSPQTSFSPFKSRMRARIFNKTPEKPQNTPEKKIKTNYSNIKSALKSNKIEQFQPPNGKIESHNKYSSPYYQLDHSHEKNDSFNKIVQPMIKKKQNQVQFESDQVQNKKGKQPLQMTAKQNIQFRDDNLFKRTNQIYRNSLIKQQYGNYVYEPINIPMHKQTGNSPYISSSNGQNVAKAKPFSQLKTINNAQVSNPSKKQIGTTSPLKMQKMKDYLPDEKNDVSRSNKKIERSPNRKTKLNYF